MEHIKQIVEQAIQSAVGETVAVEFSRPDAQFGDLATNVALQLAKRHGQNPRELATTITEALSTDAQIASVSIAGPGFINITLSDYALLKLASQAPHQHGEDSVVVIETNNPNPFKAMHIGHAFNAILGDSIANLIEQSGGAVHRVSYHGDVGTHVGKSMYSLLKFVDGDASKLTEIPEATRNSFMSEMYAAGAAAYKDDPTAKADIDELTAESFRLEDSLYREVYTRCKQWSFEQIDAIVARLGNKPIEKRYLESEADALGVTTVKAHVGDVFIESDGALVFPGEQYGIFDNVFVSRSGRGLYGARDLGLMQLKQNDYHAQKSYIVTAEEQRDYFRGVIKAAELCLPELDGVTVNISTGTVKLTTGKMSSRSGQVIEIDWLFDQVASAIRARKGQPTDDIIAGALRYQFLKVRIGSDVVFDVDESVSLHGNSGPYIQYAHARARSILAKAHGKASLEGVQLESGERELVRKLSESSEAIARATQERAPHVLCHYLYELTQSFNRFYEANRVIDDPRQAIRLGLVQLYADNLQRGLAILGITAPETM